MKKLLIGLVIFVCVFTLGAVGVTYLSIQRANEERAEIGIDLYGTYDQNDLLVNDLVEMHHGVEVKIPVIEGLKDTKIQDKVNADMYERVQKVLTGYPQLNYANYYARANFANVISISFHVGSDNHYEQIYMNYNLVDGERLKLEDLFMKDTDLTEIVRSSFYKTMVLNNRFGEEDSRVASPNENELYRVVKGYLSEEDKVFAFSPSEISFYYGDDMASVKMVDIAEQVALYSKFLTEKSLYTRDDIGYKNLFTCANGSYDIFERIEYGNLEDNFWYDITIWRDSQPEEVDAEKWNPFEEFKKRIYGEVEAKVAEYREIAKKNPEKFYILLAKPTVNMYSDSKYENRQWNYTYSDLATVYRNIQVFEMPMEVYEKVYRDKLIDTYRYEYFEMRGGAYLDTDAEDGAIVTWLNEQEIYNYITVEEITAVEDIFYEDSGYLDVIKQKTLDRLIEKYGYSQDEAEKLVETINYELDGTQVNVTIPTLDDFMVILYFNNFDVSMMKIF